MAIVDLELMESINVQDSKEVSILLRESATPSIVAKLNRKAY